MSLKPLKETVELWHRINNASSLEESLRAGNMSSFLMLEDSVEAINTLNQQIDATMADLKALDGVIPDKMANTKKAIQAASAEVAGLRLKASPKIKLGSLGDPVKKASKVMGNASALSATIIAASQTIMGSMNDFGLDVKSTETLQATLASARAQNDKLPDEKAFVGAVKKAWQPPKGVKNALKGFFSALGLGGGSDFFGLTSDAFAQDMLQATPTEIVSFINSGPGKDSAEVDEKEVAGLDDKLADAGLDKEAIAGKGDAAGGGKEGEGAGATGKKWSEISSAYLKTIDDQAAGKKLLDTLKADKGFASAVADLINLEESMYRRTLTSLLFEAVEFDVLKSAASSASDDEAAQVQLARGLAKVMADQGIEVSNIPAEEKAEEEPAAEDGEAPVADEKEAKEEQENADAELKAAVQDEAGQNQSPAAAALGAIDSWVQGLSKTSQSSLQAKNRVDGLKQAVQTSLDQAASAVEKQVAKAIKQWRSEHEETLMKSKRFAKKNFDSLQSLVPQLAGAMLKKANESSVTLTVGTINKTVYSYLDKQFSDSKPLLNEHLVNNRPGAHAEDIPYTEDDMVRYRWLKMAGLGK